MKIKKLIGNIPIPGWLFALTLAVYCETLLHLWITESFSAGRFAAVLLFALGFGGILGQIASFIGHKKWGKWITVVLTFVVAVFYIVEYFVNDAYMNFMTMETLLNGAKGVATDFTDVVISLVIRDFWRIILMVLPVVLFAVFAKPAETCWRTRWFLLAGTVAAYLLAYGVVMFVGVDAGRFSEAYNFDSAIRVFGLNVGMALDAINNGKGEGAQGNFIVVDTPIVSETEAAQPAEEDTGSGETGVVYEDNVMDFDFNALAESATNSRIANIHKYVASVTPTKKNEYTGLFAGKNLILITAEALTLQAIDPELTPTLYRLANEGIKFTDYYQPAWGGSTTSGEFSNLIGLVPTNGGACMSETTQQDLFLTMGHQLQKLGYYSVAYHNHTFNFYDRNKTHTGLGYDRFLAQYGGLEGITPVWPESDLEMMDVTVPQYIDQQPFSIYYMTVSGHSVYTQGANAMARKNYDKVADIDASEPIKCYLAAQLELEYAMESLVRQLEEAGIADDTVIVMGADHYPYGLERSSAWNNAVGYLSELYGVESYDNVTRDHNALIIWSGCIEGMDLQVDEPTYSLDILPTISNLFGVEYDSRLLVGRDVFSDAEPIVLWYDYTWRTDKGNYDPSSGKFTPNEGVEVDEGYVERIKNIVSNKIYYSREVQNMDYFQILSDYMNGE